MLPQPRDSVPPCCERENPLLFPPIFLSRRKSGDCASEIPERRPEALHIRADGFRLTQCEVDCGYSGGDCVPIRMSENRLDVDDELSEEELPAKVALGHQCPVRRVGPRLQE